MSLNSELLEILVCPDCKGKVKEENECVACTQCGKRYPIRDEIPIMLINEALPPENTEGNDK